MSKLSSTSALVLLWAQQECYRSEKAKKYLNLLDLKAGNSLYEQCVKVWPFYDEVIKNRKFGVFDLIKESFTGDKNSQQIIIAGAGVDPLGIEIVSFFPYAKIFELDMKDMDTKSSLFSRLRDTSKSNISFIDVDLLNTFEVHEKLSDYGWVPTESTLLILEGISYYLPPPSIQKLIEVIKPNRIIFEFLKQSGEIATERAKIADDVFSLISKRCNCSDIFRYDYTIIESLFDFPVMIRYNRVNPFFLESFCS